MQFKKFPILIIPLIIALLQGCFSDEDSVWVVISPVQCMGNPWERDWLERDGNTQSSWIELTAEEKINIFTEYYSVVGVEIEEVQVSYWEGDVCAACNCPRGDLLHCLIDRKDQEVMIELGFELE